jgi:hypothetical protein
VIIVKLRIRLGLVKAGKLVFCYRMLRGKDEIDSKEVQSGDYK